MNYIIGLTVNLIILIIGGIIKKTENTNYIAGFNTNDNKIDKEKLTNTVGNGLIIIGSINILLIASYIVINKLIGFNNEVILTSLESIITIFVIIGIIIKVNKK